MKTVDHIQKTGSPSPADKYLALQQSATYIRLRRRVRGFIFGMTALFLGWFLSTVLVAGWAPAFFGRKVYGNINVGLLFAVGQILSTLLITAIYLAYANHRLDPMAERIRAEFERTA